MNDIALLLDRLVHFFFFGRFTYLTRPKKFGEPGNCAIFDHNHTTDDCSQKLSMSNMSREKRFLVLPNVTHSLFSYFNRIKCKCSCHIAFSFSVPSGISFGELDKEKSCRRRRKLSSIFEYRISSHKFANRTTFLFFRTLSINCLSLNGSENRKDPNALSLRLGCLCAIGGQCRCGMAPPILG